MKNTGVTILLLAVLAFSNAAACTDEIIGEQLVDEVVAGQTAFALDLYRTLGDEPGNLFFSPLSIALALTMTSAGARGETAAEMSSVLHLPPDHGLLHPACGILQNTLQAESAGMSLAVANRLWPARGLRLRPDFVRLLDRDYRAGVEALDFAGDAAGSRATINSWIAERTAQMIPELLQPGDVTGATVLALTNAVHFRGLWKSPFPTEQTWTGPFRTAPDRTAEALFMAQNGEFLLADLPDVQVLQMNYSGDDLAFVVALPRQTDGLAALEGTLSPAVLDEWFAALSKQHRAVILPRFELDERTELKRTLIELGMRTAFGAGADFSGMFEGGGLPLDQVIHQARLQIDEEGTEAAAATAVLLKRGARPFRADHPFLFLIRDLRTGSVVFLGRFVEPVS